MDTLPQSDNWIPKRPRRDPVACCRANVPADTTGVPSGTKWKCPTCHRRWSFDAPHSMEFAEGFYFHGPDGATYWRCGRAKFIGYPVTA